MLLDTFMNFFKTNPTIIGNFIHACISIGSLPDDDPNSIVFEDVLGIFSTLSTPVVTDIGLRIPDLKLLSLQYLEGILNDYASSKKDYKEHLVALTVLIDRVIENTTDKEILAKVISICQIFKTTIQDEFLLQQFDEYLEENLFAKYYDLEVGRFQVSPDMTRSRLQSNERWKMLRSLSLRSPTKKNPEQPTYIKEEDSDSKSNFSPMNSQLLTLGKSVIEISIEEYICDGRFR